jgi:Concanavalin A-like lectin/glucanases superfamily
VAQLQLSVPQVAAAPLDYVVPGAQLIELVALNAVFDGSGAAAAFLPAVEIISDSGHTVSRSIVDTQVAAGGSAEVTFAPFLRRSGGACCGSSASGYSATVLATGPDAAWPLDETSGTTAHDQTGNGHDLGETVFAGGSIAWGASAGPPGGTATYWSGTNTGFFAHPASALAMHTDNFAAAAWVSIPASVITGQQIVGEGESLRAGATGGWCIYFDAAFNTLRCEWAEASTAQHFITADAVIARPGWHLVGFQVAAGTKSMWVNGAKQTTTSAATLDAAPANEFWLGYDYPFGLGSPSFTFHGYAQWVVLWSRPLTAAEWAALYAAGGSLPAGWVLTADGAGGSGYKPLQSDGATAGQVLTADGLGGTYWA